MDENNKKVLKIAGASALGVAAIVFASLFAWKCVTGGNGEGGGGGGSHDRNMPFLNLTYKLAEDNIPTASYIWGADKDLPQDLNSYRTITFEYTGYLGKIDWGDGTEAYTNDAYNGLATHTYANAKENDSFNIKIFGDLKTFSSAYLSFNIDQSEYVGLYDLGIFMITEAKFEEGVTYIPERCLMSAESINKVTLPSTVTDIGLASFALVGGCQIENTSKSSLLTTIELPEGLTCIEAGAFGGCTNITELKIPSTVEYIGSGAFAACTGLESLELPESLKYLGTSAFFYCDSLVNFKYSNKNLEFLGSSPFPDKYEINSIVLPEKIKFIGKGAFANNLASSVEEFELAVPSSLYYIQDEAFNWIECLKGTIDLSHVAYIGDGAFTHCWGDSASTTKLKIKVPSNYNTAWDSQWLGSGWENYVNLEVTNTIV